jgi:hypothetical protein
MNIEIIIHVVKYKKCIYVKNQIHIKHDYFDTTDLSNYFLF